MKSNWTLSGTLVAAMAITTPGHAADYSAPQQHLCAVSGLNGKIEGAGGYFDTQGNQDNGRVHVAGSFTAPITCDYGIQFDAAIGELGDNTAGGVAVHLFRRDPNHYLLGIFASFSGIESTLGPTNEIFRIAVEGEYYAGQFTFEGLIGYESADHLDFIPDGTDEDVIAEALAAYYIHDNFRIHGGYRRFMAVDTGIVGMEWMPDNWNHAAYSLFAEVQAGDNDYTSVFGGVRFYFSHEDKSLIRRHREDDPSNDVMNILTEVCTAPAPGPVMMPVGIITDGYSAVTPTDSCGRPIGKSSMKSMTR